LVPVLAGARITEDCGSLRPIGPAPAAFALIGLASLLLLVRGPAPVLGTR